VTDCSGNHASCSQTVVVQDTTLPTISCPAVLSPIQCPNTPVFPRPTVSDTCDANPTITSNDVVTAGSCAGTYSVTRTWTVTDCSGNHASCSQTVVVEDTTLPTISCPAVAELYPRRPPDRKSTRLNSSHLGISYAV